MSYGKTAQKGPFQPRNPSKYIGKVESIVFRSSWERILGNYLDKNENVIRWSSESVIVNYRHPADNLIHRYFVDFYAEIKDNNGNIRKMLIEIKPKKFCECPIEPKRKTKSYMRDVLQFAVNQAKWKYARAFAENNGMEFIVMHEDHLGIPRA
jgi:hypothetical protein